jgi:hypothetical protein
MTAATIAAMPRTRILAAAIGALVLVCVAYANAAPGNNGLFSVSCDLSHRLPDDPIVHPHMHGMSHSHEFYGNASTDANSTTASMHAAGTTCRRPEDHSGYWIPTLYKYGRPVPASSITVYYRTNGHDPSTIQPLPDGLQMVAGDAEAKALQDNDFVDWSCQQGQVFDDTILGKADARHALRAGKRRLHRLQRRGVSRKAIKAARADLGEAKLDVKPSSLPRCPAGNRDHLSLNFPDCWDGAHLDSADHKSHMAYGSYSDGERRCPANHPVAVPAITFSISWPIANGTGAKLASGPVRTMHGDVFSVWDPGTLAGHVAQCLQADVDCGSK